jgi:hypothetical protein
MNTNFISNRFVAAIFGIYLVTTFAVAMLSARS